MKAEKAVKPSYMYSWGEGYNRSNRFLYLENVNPTRKGGILNDNY